MGELWQLLQGIPDAIEFKGEIEMFDQKLAVAERENALLKMHLENARYGIEVLRRENQELKDELLVATPDEWNTRNNSTSPKVNLFPGSGSVTRKDRP
jgi:hypothetical protein